MMCLSLLTAMVGTAYAQDAAPTTPIYFAHASRPAATTPPEADAAATDVHIVINIPATTLTLYENGQQRFRAKVAVGSGIYPTPEDKMTIGHIEWNPWWIPPPSDWAKDDVKTPPGPGNPLGVVKMPMQKAVMLHGTNARSSVGRAASHGCMRMYNEDASELAWYLQTTFSEKTDPALRDVYRKNRRTTYYVKLNRSIPVDIVYDPIDVVNGEVIIFPDYYGKVRGRTFEAIITTLTNHHVDRGSIDDDHVRLHAAHWPSIETRFPLHRVTNSPEDDNILALKPVSANLRLYR